MILTCFFLDPCFEWILTVWLRNVSQVFLGPKKCRWTSGPSRLKPTISPDRCHRTWMDGDGNGFWRWTYWDYSHKYLGCRCQYWIVLKLPTTRQLFCQYFVGKDDWISPCFLRNDQKFVDDWIGHRVRNKQLVVSVLRWYRYHPLPWYHHTVSPIENSRPKPKSKLELKTQTASCWGCYGLRYN